MRITEPEFTNKKIIEYMETGRMNSLIREGIAGPFKGYVFDEEELLMCAKQLKKDFEEEGMEYTDDEAVIAMIISSYKNIQNKLIKLLPLQQPRSHPLQGSRPV